MPKGMRGRIYSLREHRPRILLEVVVYWLLWLLAAAKWLLASSCSLPENSRRAENPKTNTRKDMRTPETSEALGGQNLMWSSPSKTAPFSHQSLEMTRREAKTNGGHMLTENENPRKTQEHFKNVREYSIIFENTQLYPRTQEYFRIPEST